MICNNTFHTSPSSSSRDFFSSGVRKHNVRSERTRRITANFSSLELICELDDRLGQYVFTLDDRLGQHVRTLDETESLCTLDDRLSQHVHILDDRLGQLVQWL